MSSFDPLMSSFDQIRSDLRSSKAELEERLQKITKALEALEGKPAAESKPRRTTGKSSAKAPQAKPELLNEVMDAVRKASQPLKTKEVVRSVHASEPYVRAALKDLRDEGKIVQTMAPGKGRVPLWGAGENSGGIQEEPSGQKRIMSISDMS